MYFLPATLAYCILIAISLIMLVSYFKYHYRYLLWLSLAWFFYSFLPLTFVIFYFVEGAQFELLRTWFGRFGATIGISGVLIFWMIIRAGISNRLRLVEMNMLFLFMFSLGVMFLSINWIFDTSWKVYYEPKWGLYLGGLSTLWLMLDIQSKLYKIYKGTNHPYVKSHFIKINAGWFGSILSMGVFMVERTVSPSTTFYLLTTALAMSLIMIAIISDPILLITQNLGLRYLVVTHKETGAHLFHFDFRNPLLNEDEYYMLHSALMTGIIGALTEVVEKEAIPRKLEYENHMITLTHSTHLLLFTVSELSSTLLTDILESLVQDIETVYVPGQLQGKHTIMGNTPSKQIDRGHMQLIRYFLTDLILKKFHLYVNL